MDAAVRRSDIRCISIRPCWVQHEGNYERNLGPQVRDPSVLSPNFWSYIDVYDLADAIVLAVESPLPGHEVFYIASPDNVGDVPSRRWFAGTTASIEIRPLARHDASGISCAKAVEDARLCAQAVLARLPGRAGSAQARSGVPLVVFSPEPAALDRPPRPSPASRGGARAAGSVSNLTGLDKKGDHVARRTATI